MNDSIDTFFKSRLKTHNQVISDIEADHHLNHQIQQVATEMVSALERKRKIMWVGNGGSFADGLHLSAELVGRFMRKRRPLPALCLGANGSSVTAIGNDFGFNEVFEREFEALAQAGDVLIAHSTSGNSKNLLNLLNLAQDKKVSFFALTGKGGGELFERSESLKQPNRSNPSPQMQVLRIPSANTARIQEAHLLIGHLLCDWVDAHFSEEPN